jgi:hypothetical protein
VGDEDPPPGQQILDVPVAEVEAVMDPDGVLDDLRRKSMALILRAECLIRGWSRVSA